jgi:hypothetical protein
MASMISGTTAAEALLSLAKKFGSRPDMRPQAAIGYPD